MSAISQIKSKSEKNSKGFTLIELMVACTIFTIVMVIAIGSIISIVDANRKAQALNSVINNLNFAIESIMRDIRTGTDYSINDGGASISFINQSGRNVTYSFEAGENPKGGTPIPGKILKAVDGGDASDFTAPEVNITNVRFEGDGLGSNDGQPRVLILIEGYAGIKTNIRSNFSIQTLVSQRFLDVNG